MDALLLAGGKAGDELASLGSPDRATLPLAGRPMMGYVLDALRATPGVERLAIAGSAATLQAAQLLQPDIIAVPEGAQMIDNLVAGMHALGAPQLLVSSCDIPLVNAADFEQLLTETRRRGLEASYPIVSRPTSEAAFPGGRRTYAPMQDGVFTGGNAFILPASMIERLTELIGLAYDARKNPLALARIVGWNVVLKLLTRRLAVAALEDKMSQLLGCRCGAVIMKRAHIAFDVDKLSDYQVAEKVLTGQA